MKVSFLLISLLFSAFVNAAEVVVMEADLPVHSYASVFGDARFHIDSNSGEGFVKASVTEVRHNEMPDRWCQYDQYGRCFPGPQFPRDQHYTIFSDTAKVEGLMMMGKDLVYHGAEGNVVCGTMKPSRILKRPTLYLSGDCDLDVQISSHNMQRKVTVKLITK